MHSLNICIISGKLVCYFCCEMFSSMQVESLGFYGLHFYELYLDVRSIPMVYWYVLADSVVPELICSSHIPNIACFACFYHFAISVY